MSFVRVGKVMSRNQPQIDLHATRTLIGTIDAETANWTSVQIWADLERAKGVAEWASGESLGIGYRRGFAWSLLIHAGISYVEGNCVQAESLLDEAEAIFNEIPDPLGLARSVTHRGYIWLEREEFTTALEAQANALETARFHADRELEVELLNDMGTQYHYAGQMEESIRCFYQALELARELPSRTWEAYVTMNIGATSIERSEFSESINWVERAGAIFEEIGHHAGRAYVAMNLAEVAERQGNLDLALKHMRQAESFALDQHARGHILHELGRLNAERGSHDEARANFMESAKLNRQHDDEYQHARAALSDWQICRLTETWSEELLSNLRNAEEVFARSGGSIRKMFVVYDALIDTCRNLGHTETALEYACRSSEARERFWMHLADQRSMLTSKLHQLSAARSEADRERAQREELQKLHRENEMLILQLREQAAMLERQATEDPLTQLGNRRYFDAHLEHELVRSARFDRPLSVALLDVDYFKQVNDRFTHQVGDRVLKHLAMLLRSGVRETDFVARYGGEEFALLFPETDLEAAGQLTERLRATIQDHDWSDFGLNLSVTISVGLVSGDGHSSFSRLMASADAMLYLAKHRGRNQVRAITMDESIIEPGVAWRDVEIVMSAERTQRFAAAS